MGRYVILTYCEEWKKAMLEDFKNIGNRRYLEKIKKDLEQKNFDVRVNNHQAWSKKDELENILEKEMKGYLRNIGKT